MPANYDVNEVIKQFLRGNLQERAELIREIREALAVAPSEKHLAAQIATEAANQKLLPVQVLRLGLLYGMVVGIMLEKEHAGRKRVLVQ